MFEWLFGKNKYKEIEEKTQEGFFAVKKDIEVIGKWIKHLDNVDKQVFESLNSLSKEVSSLKEDVEVLKDSVESMKEEEESKQVFEKMIIKPKQQGVYAVENGVQTPVQTGNFYEILKILSANERLVLLTLLNSEMKLSYEDLALLLGKERATIRGQVNSIKQKCDFIREIVEKNGKKRVYIPDEIKEKFAKYAKVRVTNEKNRKKESKK